MFHVWKKLMRVTRVVRQRSPPWRAKSPASKARGKEEKKREREETISLSLSLRRLYEIWARYAENFALEILDARSVCSSNKRGSSYRNKRVIQRKLFHVVPHENLTTSLCRKYIEESTFLHKFPRHKRAKIGRAAHILRICECIKNTQNTR